jgi:hypothetical protein
MDLVKVETFNQYDSVVTLMKDKGLIPKSVKTTEEALSIIAMGASLGMEPMIALQSLEFIQGNLTVKAKIVSGLLAKAGISTEVVKDYEPVYETELKPIPLYKSNPDGTTEPVMKDGKICYALNDDGSVKTREVQKEVDKVTEIKFYRYNSTLGRVIENSVRFYWSDAVSAQWSTKDNWKKNPRYMMYARALTRGARMIASDVICGLYDNLEVQDFDNVKRVVDLDVD